MKAAFYTLGCKVNQYDTEVFKDILAREGFGIVDFKDNADIYIINTCIVTHVAERKSRQYIRKAKRMNPDSYVAVVGCYPQVFPEKADELEEVDFYLGTTDRLKILDLVKRLKDSLAIDSKTNTDKAIISRAVSVSPVLPYKDEERFEDLELDYCQGRKGFKSRHFLKVQEGCERFCSYCIVPYARGKVKSRPLISIIKEAKKALESGFKEIILTGSNLGAYGDESFYKPDLVDLIRALTSINEEFRIRLSSIEPMEIDKRLIEEIKRNNKICPHLHIPLQSGDDKVLQDMNRPYNRREFKKLMEMILRSVPDISLTTDIIVGFPGEDEENFLRTKNFLKDIGFADLHVFRYSKREKTPAAEFSDQVDENIKEQRSLELINLAGELNVNYQKSFLGRKLRALVETEQDGYYTALTGNYLKVLIISQDFNKNNVNKGEIVKVKPYLFDKKLICKIIK